MSNARLDQLDYYALLKVPRDAAREDIRSAFHRFAAKYHPDRYTGRGAEAQLVARAAEVYRRGAEAYRVLCDARQRRAYDHQLSLGNLRYDASMPPPPVRSPGTSGFPVRLRNPAARPFVLNAEKAYKSGDWQACQFNLKLALNRDREHPELLALLGEVEAKLTGA